MRRRTRRALINVALFLSALFLILYLNRQPTTATAFAWTRIRYKTTSSILPETRGICPGLTSNSKPALVVARVATDGNSSWLNALSEKFHLCIYDADAPLDIHSTQLQIPANIGREAMVYLTFLIDNYAEIPAMGAVFVHGSRWAWHNDSPDYDNAVLLAALNVSAALEPLGYHNLRCDWSAGTCPRGSAPPQGSLETKMSALLEPWNARAVSDAALPHALEALFGNSDSVSNVTSTSDEQLLPKSGERVFLGRRDTVRAQCCAQFVVARERVWQHSREEYFAIRQWLTDKNKNSGNGPKERFPGRILSYLWHILFTPQDDVSTERLSSDADNGIDLERLNKLACPRADECYCRLYGRCNLDGCTKPGHCRGQYTLPEGLKLPANWPHTHS